MHMECVRSKQVVTAKQAPWYGQVRELTQYITTRSTVPLTYAAEL